jgi:hypothetical protein
MVFFFPCISVVVVLFGGGCGGLFIGYGFFLGGGFLSRVFVSPLFFFFVGFWCSVLFCVGYSLLFLGIVDCLRVGFSGLFSVCFGFMLSYLSLLCVGVCADCSADFV